MIKIGDTELSSSCVLAPMAGISDLPFRMINRAQGCKFAFLEMISARSLVYESGKTGKMLSTIPEDRPLGVQLLGSDPLMVRQAVERLREYSFDIIDFNAACPAGKVTRKGRGASLLKDPRKLRDLLKLVVEGSDVPVTVKIRAGWDQDSVNAKDAALHARDAGISGLFIHGRTKAQRYSGTVDYNVIKEVKDALDIPVIASGDAFSPQLIKKMFDETGCDGVVIARGALGNPWIFRETSEYLKNGVTPQRPGTEEVIKTMLEHLNLYAGFYGEKTGTIIFRKFFAWYSRGVEGVKPLREKAFRANTEQQMSDTIKELYDVMELGPYPA